MATRIASPQITTTLATDAPHLMGPRIVPVSAPSSTMSATNPGEPMEISSPTNTSSHSQGQDSDLNGKNTDRSKNSPPDHSSNSNLHSSMPAPPPAAAAVHQPKIVQTAFIHKLYK